MRHRIPAILAALLLGLAPAAVPAATRSFSYQGQLTNLSDVAIDSNQNMAFEIYDALSGGNLVAGWPATNVPVSRGLFNVELPLPALTASQLQGGLWLEITVAGQTLAPRKQIHASFFTLSAESLQGRQPGSAGGDIPVILTSTGRLDPAILSAPFPLEVSGVAGGSLAAGTFVNYDLSVGQSGLLASGASRGVQGTPFASDGTGVHGQANAADSSGGTGVLGTATNGVGVRAQANAQGTTALQALNPQGLGLFASGDIGGQLVGATEGLRIGGGGLAGQPGQNTPLGIHIISTQQGIKVDNSGPLAAISARGSGAGVAIEGESTAANGIGLRGEHTGTGFGTGVWGLSNAFGGTGMRGEHGALSGPGAGVRGSTGSADGYGIEGSGPGVGVRGESGGSAASGTFAGVYGIAAAPNGAGVRGLANGAGQAYGLYGVAAAGSGAGAFGQGPLLGVHGVALAGNSAAIGVRGEALARGVYGVASQASGNLSVGVEGLSSSPDGAGIKGQTAAGSGSGAGVWGASAALQGLGVYGEGRAAGVKGLALAGLGAGVLGDGGPAASGEGRVGVRGTVTLAPGELGYAVHAQLGSTAGNGYGVYSEVYGNGQRAIRAYNNQAQGGDSGYALGVHGKLRVSTENAKYWDEGAGAQTQWLVDCDYCGERDVVLLTPAMDITAGGSVANSLWVARNEVANGSFTVRSAQPIANLRFFYFVVSKD